MKKIRVFVPTYFRLNQLKDSLLSVIGSIKGSKYDIQLIIGDNNSDKDTVEWLKSFQKTNKGVVLYLSDKNVGKAEIVNYMYSLHSDCDYVVSMDSDLVWEGNGLLFDEMVEAMELFPQFGLLSMEQTGNCCHLEGLFSKTKNGRHKVRFGNYRSVAGGCFIIRKQLWDMIGGYRDVGIYSADDAYVMLDVSKTSKVGVLETISMFHPFDTDEGYKCWKSQNITKYNIKGYYDN